MTDTVRIVVLKPGDTLFVGNLGSVDEDEHGTLASALASLVQTLRLGGITLFEHDIHVAAAEPVMPVPDGVVLRYLDRNTVEQHREELAEWLKSNGIDHTTVALDWLTVEQAGQLLFIRYPAYRLTQDGRRMVDPRDPDRAWTVERVSPLVIELDLPAGQTVTQGDGNP